MKNLFVLFLLAGFVFCFGCKSNETKDELHNQTLEESVDVQTKQNAINSALDWLTLIDTKKYGDSWEAAADIFKKAIIRETWVKTVENVRSDFGKYFERELISATFTKTLPGAPDGDYFVIQFNAKFENNENAVETIIPVKDNNGYWRISGYFIK